MSPNSNLYEHIANRIKELRLMHGGTGVSQEALAREIGVATNTISRWETGAYKPAAIDLDRLARFFGISVLEFFPEHRVAESEAFEGLLRAAKDLPSEDVLELQRYAEFRRARSLLKKSSGGSRRKRASDKD